MKEEQLNTEENAAEKEEAVQDQSSEECNPNEDKENQEEEELSELDKKEIELKEMNDKYIRLYSEFDNFRRRTQKEKLDLYKTAGEEVFKSLLPVMDDFERALKSMEDTKDYESLKTGVDLIHSKLIRVFKSNGAEPMESSVGKVFDSEIHEAVTQIPAPSKKMKGKVVDEIERGYMLKDKVIRFAKVVVGN